MALRGFFVIAILALGLAALNGVRVGAWSAKAVSATRLPEGVGAADLAAVRAAVRASNRIFLDARGESAFREGHIPGALWMPAERAAERVEALSLDPQAAYVIYCDGGNCFASIELARRLRLMDFTRLEVFEGGWDAWSAAGSRP